MKSTLIIKLGSLGDVLRTTSILSPLKFICGRHRIEWVTSSEAKPLLYNNPFLDECYSVEEFRKLDRRTKYEEVICLDETWDAAKLASTISNNVTGFFIKCGCVVASKSAYEWFRMGILGPKKVNNTLKKNNTLTYQQHMLKIIGIEGLSPPAYPIVINLTSQEKYELHNFKVNNRIRDEDTVVGFNTGAGNRWQRKKLSIEQTVEMIFKTKLIYPNVKIILFGGPEEKERNARIKQFVDELVIDAGTDNSLRDFAAKVGICDVLLTSDSLAMHIGIALKKHVIAFFGPTSSDEIELYGNGKKVVTGLDCHTCYHKKCNRVPSCMDNIGERLFEALLTLPPKTVPLVIRVPAC